MRARTWQKTHSQAGFSLMETIVAVALFAGMFVLLNRGLTTSWQGVRRADLDAGAVALATAQLASAGIETPLVDGTRTFGQQGLFRWDLSIDKYAEPPDDSAKEVAVRDVSRSANAAALTAYWVSIVVSWSSGVQQSPRQLRLRTLRLGRS